MKRRKNAIRKTRGDAVLDIFVWGILLLFSFICLYPFWYVIVASFNDGYDMMAGGVYWFPRKFTVQNYVSFFSQANWLNAIKISILRTVIGTICTTFFTCMVSYAISRRDLIFGKTYRFMFVICMYVSGGMIPFYMVLRFIGLINSFGVYIFPPLLSLYFTMVGINFFRSIPHALIESGKLDGASEIRIFLRIVLPLSIPFVATLALFTGVHQWNSWVDSVYYVNDKNLRPMAYWMVSMLNQSKMSNNLELGATITQLTSQATAVIATVAPILCIYPFLQKYFVQGLMVGSVKE